MFNNLTSTGGKRGEYPYKLTDDGVGQPVGDGAKHCILLTARAFNLSCCLQGLQYPPDHIQAYAWILLLSISNANCSDMARLMALVISPASGFFKIVFFAALRKK